MRDVITMRKAEFDVTIVKFRNRIATGTVDVATAAEGLISRGHNTKLTQVWTQV